MHDYLGIINGKQIPNLPLDMYDIMEAEDILWTNLGSLKVNTTRISSTVSVVTRVSIPPGIKERYTKNHPTSW